MFPSWVRFALPVDCQSCSSAGAAAGHRLLCCQLQRESKVDLERRVEAVPNLDLFVLPDPLSATGEKFRCIKTRKDSLEALLLGHANRTITAYCEYRERYFEAPLDVISFLAPTRTFIVIELDGGEYIISAERCGDQLQVMLGEGMIMRHFSTAYRASGEKRSSISSHLRLELGPSVGLPWRSAGDFLAWLNGPLLQSWRPSCLFKADEHRFAQELISFLEGSVATPVVAAATPALSSSSPATMSKKFAHDPSHCNEDSICCIASKANSRPMWFMEDGVLTDRMDVLVAVQADGEALSYAAEAFRNDRSIVLAAVQQNGQALRFASDELKHDREVVLAAIMQDPVALQYAPHGLRTDPQVLLATLPKKAGPAPPGRASDNNGVGGGAGPDAAEFSEWTSVHPASSSTCRVAPKPQGNPNGPTAAIANRLRDDQPSVRKGACLALAQLGQETVMQYADELAIRLKDPNGDVREAACKAFATTNPPASAPFMASLPALLEDPDPSVRVAACKAFSKLGPGSEALMAILAERLADVAPAVRVAAQRALENFGSASVRIFVSALEAEDIGLRQAACQSLGKMGLETIGSKAVAALAKGLDDERWQIRVAACDALGLLGEAATEPHGCRIAMLLADDDGDVRRAALETLAQLGGALASIVGFIAAHLNDPRWPVRVAGCKALSMMGSAAEPYTNALAQLAQHDFEVQEEARQALLRLGIEV